MEDVLKDLAGDATPSVPVVEAAVPLPEPEPNNNLRDAGIVIGVFVVAAICYKLYLATAKVKND